MSRIWCRRLALVAGGTLLAIAGLELLLWSLARVDAFGEGWFVREEIEIGFDRALFVADDELGYRPNLGGPLYAATGTLHNDYARDKRPGIERLLFIGDSVTARCKIVDALRQLYGERQLEFWNAGVEGFNTVQEVRYYELYNAAVEPDHVILTFHNNDFRVTPVIFESGDGTVSVLDPSCDVGRVHPWLLRYSQLYRRHLCSKLTARNGDDLKSGVPATSSSLRRLQDLLRRDDIELSVVLLPILRPYEAWSREEMESRRLALELFEDLDLRSFDLLEPLQTALKDGDDPCESPGDSWHPSWAAALRFASFLRERGLLATGPQPDHPMLTAMLTADVRSISLADGGVQRLSLDAGAAYRGRSYAVLGSASGTSPATQLHLVRVPLATDAYFQLTVAHPNTWITGSLGVLDETGRAWAEILVPAGAPATNAGTVLQHVYVVFRPIPLTFYACSNAVSLELTR